MDVGNELSGVKSELQGIKSSISDIAHKMPSPDFQDWKKQKATWVMRLLELNILTMTVILFLSSNVMGASVQFFFTLAALLFTGNLIFGVITFWVQGRFIASLGSHSTEERIFRLSDKIIVIVSGIAFILIFIGLFLLVKSNWVFFMQEMG